jgi:hypothetical protein
MSPAGNGERCHIGRRRQAPIPLHRQITKLCFLAAEALAEHVIT